MIIIVKLRPISSVVNAIVSGNKLLYSQLSLNLLLGSNLESTLELGL